MQASDGDMTGKQHVMSVTPAGNSAPFQTLKPHKVEIPSPEPSNEGVSEEKKHNESLVKEKPIRRKRRVKGQKICTVCGDLAQSHNFGALTCETCKAFFRRNAFKLKDLQTCIFNSSCIITKATRRFCAPCRLKKCYGVGMDPELILDDEEKKARLSKREKYEVCTKKEKSDGDTHVSTSSNVCVSSFSFNNFSTSPQSSDSTNYPGSPSTFNYPGKGQWHRPRNALGCHFKHVAREDLPWDMQLFWPLTVEERTLLTKLTSSYQTVTATVSSEDRERLRQWETFCMEKALFALEYSMRQYVQYARSISEFQQLSQGDQIALLKASALQWYHIRLASEFIPEQRSWVNIFGSMNEVELGGFFDDIHGVKEYADFCESLKFVVKNDTTLYALMHTLILFDPRNPNIENRIFVNSINDKYLILLKHHLESQFSFLHADRYLTEIMGQVLDLFQLSQSSLVFFKHFSSQFRPLIAEMFSC